MVQEMELKPCPFCGNKAKIWIDKDYDRARIGCGNNRCRGYIEYTHWDDRKESIKTWNQRKELLCEKSC